MSKNKNNYSKEHPLAKIVKFGVYVIAFIPLVIFSDFLSPFHFGKVVVLRSIIEVLAVFYLILILSPGGKSYLPPKSKILWAFIAFAGIFGLTSLTSINSFQSFWGNLERMGGFFTFLHYLVLFIMASAVLRTKQDWIRLIQVSLFVGILSAFYGFLQKTDVSWVIGSGGRNKIFGTIGNPALFAGYMIVNAFLALSMFARKESTSHGKQFYFLAFLVTSLGILLAGVRGSVLGWVVGLLIFGYMYKSENINRNIKKYTTMFLILVVATAGILFSLRGTDFVRGNSYLDRYSDISPKTYTVQTRVWAWTAGLQGWDDSAKTMLLGFGPENFNYPFSFNFNPKFYNGPGSETLFDRAHNMFMEVLVTMGAIGLIAYILLFVAAFAAIKRFKDEDKILGVGFIALLVAYMIHNSFIFDTSANFVIFFTALGFINFLDPKTVKRELVVGNNRLGAGLGFLMIVLLAFSALFINKINIKPAKANYITTRAIIASWGNDIDRSIEKYTEAMEFDVPMKYEIRHRYAQYIINQSNKSKALEDPRVVDGLKLAIEKVQANIDENPQDYLPLLYQARLNIMLGRGDPSSEFNDAALDNSLAALEIAPTFVRGYFEVSQAYLNQKNYSKAIEYFQTAYDLHPEASISAWYLGMAYVDSGEVQKGLNIIDQSGHSFNAQQSLRMINLYVTLNRFDKVVELYENIVISNPTNPQFYASLAVAYARVGRIDDAVNTALKAAQIDPDFAGEAQAFLRSLGR